MATLHALSARLKELDDQLINCMRCGMCQAVCPLFAQTGKESDVTRGKLALLDGLASEILRDATGVNEKLNKCLLCGTCQSNCPSGVKVLDIFIKARAVMTEYFGLSRIKRAIFRGMLARPELFNKLLSFGAVFQSLFTRKVDEMLGSSCARFQAPIIGDRHFPSLADKPLHTIVAAKDTPAGDCKVKVGFFVGCVIDKVYPRVGQAAFTALEHHNVGVFLPSGQACCGIPAISSGDTATFNKLVEMNLSCFETGGFDYLLTACATCTSTIKELWPTMYQGNAAPHAVRDLAAKTMDISQFLVDVLGVQPLNVPGAKTVTYHDPCHLKNSLGVTAQPRAVIEASSGCDFIEMAEAGTCCGCGGSFNIAHYDLSKKIGNHKADNIIGSGASTVATSCPACMMQITDVLSQKKAGVNVKHVVELYAEGLR